MIKSIDLKNTRRFKKFHADIKNKIVIITGSNAIGKTTILEALYIASITKSHRTNNLSEIINNEADFAEIKINDFNNEFKIIISKEGKSIKKNRIDVTKLSDYIGEFPTIFFSPNDLNLVTGSPAIRRFFLNKEISQIHPHYLKALSLYNSLLHERNACLKEINIDSDSSYLDIVTKQMLEAAKKVITERSKLVNDINLYINYYNLRLNNKEKIQLVYHPSVSLENCEMLFEQKKVSDILAHQTQLGPQRDEIIFNLNGKNLAKFGSQGQIRSVVLSLKITLCRIFKEYRGIYPTLLLDDVLSELDSERQNNLLKLIDELEQTFITTVDIGSVLKDNLDKYQIIQLQRSIENGK